MDKQTMMMLGVVALAGGAYLLYAKQSSAAPLSYLPQFGRNPYGAPLLGQPRQPDQTAALIAAGGSVAARLLPSIFDFGSNLVSRFSTPSTGVLQNPAGYGVLQDSPSWYSLDFLNAGYSDMVGGGGSLQPTNVDDSWYSGYL